MASSSVKSTNSVVAVPGNESAMQYGLSSEMINTTKALIAGGIAGGLSRTATSPLERLKVMKQVQASGNQYDGIFKALAKMYREEGFLSYWKGNGVNVARIAPFSAIQFFSFDVYKRWILPKDDGNFLRTFAAGALTGCTASTACYPLDLVRSYLTVQTTNTHYRGVFDVMRSIVRDQGVLGLYRGLTPTLMGIAPYIAINMTTFDLLKRHFLPSRDDPNFLLINLSCGACAGFAAAGITYPTDLIRRRMQLQNMAGSTLPKYNSTAHCIRQIIATEGVAGLYKGMIPCFMKVVPSMAIAFTTYESLRGLWKFDPPKSKPPSAG